MDLPLTLSIGGETVETRAREGEPLIAVLRDRLGLTGTRFGCGGEMCGACMVLLDGQPVFSCTLDARDACGREIRTVERLGHGPGLHPVQQAILEEQAGQCGYCLSGIAVSAVALLERVARPSRQEIVAALEPHLCRCGAHERIIRAVERAAAMGSAGR